MRLDNSDVVAAVRSLIADPPPLGGLGTRFSRLADDHPDRLAVVDGNDRRSFLDLERAARQLARALGTHGVGPGGRVAIVLPNSADFVAIALAAWKTGAAVVPISHRLPVRERDSLLQLARPTLSVLAEDAGPPAGLAATTLNALLAEATHLPDDPLPDIVAAPWKVIASGGSTGSPKLIVDPGPGPIHRGVAAMFGIRPAGVELVAGPLYHNGPFSWGVIQLMAGGTIVLAEKFEPEAYLKAIEAERVTWSFVVPTMMHRILSLPTEVVRGYDFSSLEVVLHSAAPCPAWLKRKAIDLFGPDRLWEYYGAAEVPGTMIRGDDWLARPGSVGRPVPGLEVIIRDDSGQVLPVGQVGEIWIRPPGGPTFRYEGAQERIEGAMVSVGDLGWLDPEEYLYISDRRTDMIISGGVNIFPAEIEGVLLEHTDIADVAVVGLRDPEWGQTVHAIVEAKVGADLVVDELAPFCRARLASHKVPKSFEIVAALPRDPSGKLSRSALRDERDRRGVRASRSK